MNKDQGFSPVEIIVALTIVLLVCLSGWFVWHNQRGGEKDGENNKKPKAQQLTDTLSKSAERLADEALAEPGPATDPNAENNTAAPVESHYWHSKFANFTFKFPDNWKKKIWSDDTSGSAITVSDPQTGIPLSAGSPVVAPQSDCSAAGAVKMVIHSVSEVQAHNGFHTYLITYSYTYPNEIIKGAAFTDWDATDWSTYTAPTVGQTDKCGYIPTVRYQAKQGGDSEVYTWFKLDMPDKYSDMSPDEYFALPEVKAMLDVMKTGTYIYYGLPEFS